MRTFVAVQISDAGIIDWIGRIQSGIGAGHRHVRPENLHFTLQFLGEIPEDVLGKAVRAVEGIRFSGFDVSLRGIGAFPSARRPRAVWVGTDSAGGDMLVGLSGKVREALEPLGLSPDKPFRPHLTIFRIKKKTDNMTEEMKGYDGMCLGTQRIESIRLKKSVLGPDGPAYSDLAVVGAV